MRFEQLGELVRSLDLGEPGRTARPPRENVRAVQDALSASLAEEEFCLDCIELELDAALATRRAPGALAAARPFHEIAGRGIFFRFYYWPPGKVAPPHEHTSWTVTAVFHNALTVTTYDWETAEKERRLEARSTFSAERGRAGHIYFESIHAPSNTTERLTASIHVFNANDRPVLAERVGEVPGLAPDMAARRWPAGEAEFAHAEATWRQRFLLMIADLLAPFRSARALALLDRVFEEGDALVKFVVAIVLRAADERRSQERMDRLVAIAPEYRERVNLVLVRS